MKDDYTDRALKIISTFKPGREFTSDDLLDWLGSPPHKNTLGGLFQHLAELAIVTDTGNTVVSSRREARGRRIRVWRKAWVTSGDPNGDSTRHHSDADDDLGSVAVPRSVLHDHHHQLDHKPAADRQLHRARKANG